MRITVRFMNEIYYDNSATTKVSEKALHAACRAMREDFGNPSSAHAKGVSAYHALNEARSVFAGYLNVASDELYFSSCGTESNNMIILGAAKAAGKQGKILISAVEHPSVYESARHLASLGYQVELIPVDRQGIIDMTALEQMLDTHTILVSIMHVNNETGAIQPLKQAGALIRAICPQALFHVDAVQSFGRIPLFLAAWQADAVSMSGHKIHAPKGVGLLWLKKTRNIPALIWGGGQERGFRSGTENMSGIMAFTVAAEECYTQMDQNYAVIVNVRGKFLDDLRKAQVDFHLNGPQDEQAAAHILNLSFPGIRSEVMLHSLEAKGVYVSAGSACTSMSTKGSRILTAMGLPSGRIDCALRFSFSRYNTVDEATIAAAAVVDTVLELHGILNSRKGKKTK